MGQSFGGGRGGGGRRPADLRERKLAPAQDVSPVRISRLKSRPAERPISAHPSRCCWRVKAL
jgi:hypothetical protein